MGIPPTARMSAQLSRASPACWSRSKGFIAASIISISSLFIAIPPLCFFYLRNVAKSEIRNTRRTICRGQHASNLRVKLSGKFARGLYWHSALHRPRIVKKTVCSNAASLRSKMRPRDGIKTVLAHGTNRTNHHVRLAGLSGQSFSNPIST